MPTAWSRLKLVGWMLVVAWLGGCTQDFHVFEQDGGAADAPNDGGHQN